RKIVRESTSAAGMPMDVDRVDALVLTHLHGDHASGIEGLAFYFRYILGRKLPVITHPDVAASLWDRHLAGGMEFSLQEPGRPPVQRRLSDFLEVTLIEEQKPLLH